MDKPKLRHIQAFPLEHQGKKAYGIRDPNNLAKGPLVLEPDIFFIISLFDGKNSLVDIQAAYMRKFGELLFSERLNMVIEEMDKYYYLESENFSNYFGQLVDAFKKAEVRLPSHAGQAYKSEGEELKKQIAGFFSALEEEKGNAPAQAAPAGRVKGIIAPHIDFQRGGISFAHAFRELLETEADLFVILGTAHSAQRSPFILTDKDFQTPIGRMPTDKDFIGRLRKRCSSDFDEEEFLHRDEHSIEFQVLFLQYILGEARAAKMVPVLCGPYLESLRDGVSPSEIPAVRIFLDALQEELGAYKGQWCLIAGADLAHVGPQFGARRTVTAGDLERLEAEDRAMLALIEKGDAEAFSRDILKDRDQRNVCGYPPIYTFLKSIGNASGKLLRYDQAANPNGTVSFAAMAFYE